MNDVRLFVCQCVVQVRSNLAQQVAADSLRNVQLLFALQSILLVIKQDSRVTHKMGIIFLLTCGITMSARFLTVEYSGSAFFSCSLL